MSQPVQKPLPTNDPPKREAMRLHRVGDTVDLAEPTNDAGAATWSIDAGDLFVEAGTELPQRCVQCGDTMDLLSTKTLPGRIRYHVCREHAVAAIAKGGAGLLLAMFGAWGFATEMINLSPGTVMTTFVYFLMMSAGLAVAYFAVPLRVSLPIQGKHRIGKHHAEIDRDFQRSVR